MRQDLVDQIDRLEPLIKHCVRSAKAAFLLFLAMLILGGINDLYIYVSHQPTWYPWLSNIPMIAGMWWQGSVVWKNFRDWQLFHQARFHMTMAGNALTSSGMDHHLEQADAALSRIKISRRF